MMYYYYGWLEGQYVGKYVSCAKNNEEKMSTLLKFCTSSNKWKKRVPQHKDLSSFNRLKSIYGKNSADPLTIFKVYDDEESFLCDFFTELLRV